MDETVVQGWPIEALVMGLVNISDELAKDEAGDDWGYPRIWHLASSLLQRLSRILPEQRWTGLVEQVFTAGQSIGFISHLLRSETFSHGFYGNRPDESDCITTRAMFDKIRPIMLQRYAAGGLDQILADRNGITSLYAWSQAGGREDVVRAVAERCQDDGKFIEFMLKICSTSTSSDGANLSLSLDAIHNFFDSPPDAVRRVLALLQKAPPTPGAESVLGAVARSARFDGTGIEQALEAWEKKNAPEERDGDQVA